MPHLGQIIEADIIGVPHSMQNFIPIWGVAYGPGVIGRNGGGFVLATIE